MALSGRRDSYPQIHRSSPGRLATREAANQSYGLNACYCPCPGLVTGGRLFRKSVCCRSASRCRSNSRVFSSGLGPGVPQPDKKRRPADARSTSIGSFFIKRDLTIIRSTDPAIVPDPFQDRAVISIAPAPYSRRFSGVARRESRSRIFNR
jgi:hypothetical protein